MKQSGRLDVTMLFLRVALGLLLALGHGLAKLAAIRAGGGSFPDPLGLGPLPSALAAMATECGASACVALGLFTRLMTLPIIFTMATICLLAHPGEPWLNKEPSVLFMVGYATIFLLGPGRLSIDGWRTGRRQTF